MLIAAPWITATGQRWKLRVLLSLTVLAFLAFVGATVPSVSQWVTPSREAFVLVSVGLIAVWLMWTGLAIRCPDCNGKVGLWYMRNKSVVEWFTQFVNTDRCPMCGGRDDRGG